MGLRSKALSLIVAASASIGLTALPAHAIGGQVVAYDGVTAYLSPPMQFVGGSGSFGFTTQICQEASPVGQCGMGAGWSYSNIVCGTGTADGAGFVQPRPGTFNFHITFVSGIGLMTGGGTGLVVEVPTKTGPSPNCVDRFVVTGVFNT